VLGFNPVPCAVHANEKLAKMVNIYHVSGQSKTVCITSKNLGCNVGPP